MSQCRTLPSVDTANESTATGRSPGNYAEARGDRAAQKSTTAVSGVESNAVSTSNLAGVIRVRIVPTGRRSGGTTRTS